MYILPVEDILLDFNRLGHKNKIIEFIEQNFGKYTIHEYITEGIKRLTPNLFLTERNTFYENFFRNYQFTTTNSPRLSILKYLFTKNYLTEEQISSMICTMECSHLRKNFGEYLGFLVARFIDSLTILNLIPDDWEDKYKEQYYLLLKILFEKAPKFDNEFLKYTPYFILPPKLFAQVMEMIPETIRKKYQIRIDTPDVKRLGLKFDNIQDRNYHIENGIKWQVRFKGCCFVDRPLTNGEIELLVQNLMFKVAGEGKVSIESIRNFVNDFVNNPKKYVKTEKFADIPKEMDIKKIKQLRQPVKLAIKLN